MIVCGFPGDTVVKNLPARAGDTGLIPGSGRSFGVGNGNPFYYSWWDNFMDRGVWQARAHGIAESDRTEHAVTHTHVFMSVCSVVYHNFQPTGL